MSHEEFQGKVQQEKDTGGESTMGEHLSDLGVGKFARSFAAATAISALGVEVGLQDPSIHGLANMAKTEIENVYHKTEEGTKAQMYEHDLKMSEEELAMKKELAEELGRVPNYGEFQLAEYLSMSNSGEDLRAFVQEMKYHELSPRELRDYLQTMGVHTWNNKMREGTLPNQADWDKWIQGEVEKDKAQEEVQDEVPTLTVSKDASTQEISAQVEKVMDAYRAK
jgi:hypothetical protein